MFNKLLIKALKKRFEKLSPEEKQIAREMVNNETISDATEKKQKVKKRRTEKMADEKEVKIDEVATEKLEAENNGVEETAQNEVVENKEEVVEENNNENVEETTNNEPDYQVQEVGVGVDGLRLEDLVTKEMLLDKLAAFDAKLDAILKENIDLKNELSTKSDELDGMKDKYENKDFGNFQKQGVQTKDRFANSSFEEYSKQFM